MRRLITILVFILGNISLYAQIKIGGDPSVRNEGSMLEIESNNKGFLIPRVSLTSSDEWGLDGTPIEGMMLYNTNAANGLVPGFYYYVGTAWIKITNTSDINNIKSLNGNIGINEPTPFASLSVSNNESTITPALQLKSPFSGDALSDSLLTWNPVDSTIRKMPRASLFSNIVGNIGINESTPFASLSVSNNESTTTPALQLKSPFSGDALSDSLLTWNPVDSTIRKIPRASLFSNITGHVGINNSNSTSSLSVSNSGSITIPALQLKTPFSGLSTDSILTWNPADSTVRMISSSNIASKSITNLTGNIGINNSNSTASLSISNNGTATPALQIKSPFHGLTTDSILTWNPADSTVRMVSSASIKSGAISNLTGNIGINNSNSTASLSISNNGTATPALQIKSPFHGLTTDSILTWNPADSTVRMVSSASIKSGAISNLTGNIGINNSNSTASLSISNNGTATPALQIKSPFHGLTTDSILTWNPADSTVRMVSTSIFATTLTNSWNITGNGATNPGTNFLGTTDDKDLVFKRKNVQAGWLNTTNTAFGVSTLSISSTGTNNTAIGDSTLTKNTTGFSNTALGHASLSNVTTGIENTAVGTNSLRNVIGSGNTAIGKSSLQNALGNNNIAIGYNAGLMGVTFSGSNNIMIGTNTAVPSPVNSNQMNIGNCIFGTGMSGTTAAPVGRIGIDTVSPNSTLHVNGSLTLPIKTVTADYTLTDKDYTVIAKSPINLLNPTDITLPAPSSCTGRLYNIVLGSIPPVYINGSIQELGLSTISIISSLTLVPGGDISITLQSDGTNWIIINK